MEKGPARTITVGGVQLCSALYAGDRQCYRLPGHEGTHRPRATRRELEVIGKAIGQRAAAQGFRRSKQTRAAAPPPGATPGAGLRLAVRQRRAGRAKDRDL